MVQLFYAKNDVKLNEERFFEYLDKLPTTFINKIKRYRRWEDAQSCLFGLLILEHILAEHENKNSLKDIKFTKAGRPYISDHFDFNISHSGKYVVCAYSNEGKVGIDLEIIGNIEIFDLKSIFSNEEFEQIASSSDIHNSFYNFWTIKEAAAKADGRGLTIPLKKIKIQDHKVMVDEKEWLYKNVQFEEQYVLHVVTDKPIEIPYPLTKIEFQNQGLSTIH